MDVGGEEVVDFFVAGVEGGFYGDEGEGTGADYEDGRVGDWEF